MTKLRAQIKFAVGALAMVAMLAFAQVKTDQMINLSKIHDVQDITLDDVDIDQKLDFTELNSNLDHYMFVKLKQDNVDIHVIVDTVDYSLLNETVVELHIADNSP
ncbi:MAG: hypothetical protein ACK5LJ_16680, partial [Paracoccus sp. (in: a-proteobacteria)]